jgi:hypothetical protein
VECGPLGEVEQAELALSVPEEDVGGERGEEGEAGDLGILPSRSR